MSVLLAQILFYSKLLIYFESFVLFSENFFNNLHRKKQFVLLKIIKIEKKLPKEKVGVTFCYNLSFILLFVSRTLNFNLNYSAFVKIYIIVLEIIHCSAKSIFFLTLSNIIEFSFNNFIFIIKIILISLLTN